MNGKLIFVLFVAVFAVGLADPKPQSIYDTIVAYPSAAAYPAQAHLNPFRSAAAVVDYDGLSFMNPTAYYALKRR